MPAPVVTRTRHPHDRPATTRCQWIVVTIIICVGLVSAIWALEAYLFFHLQLAALSICPVCPPCPSAAVQKPLDERLLAHDSPSVHGLATQDAAATAIAAAIAPPGHRGYIFF